MSTQTPADEPDTATTGAPDTEPAGARLGQPVATTGYVTFSMRLPKYKVDAVDKLLRDTLGINRRAFIEEAVTERLRHYGVAP